MLLLRWTTPLWRVNQSLRPGLLTALMITPWKPATSPSSPPTVLKVRFPQQLRHSSIFHLAHSIISFPLLYELIFSHRFLLFHFTLFSPVSLYFFLAILQRIAIEERCCHDNNLSLLQPILLFVSSPRNCSHASVFHSVFPHIYHSAPLFWVNLDDETLIKSDLAE